MKYLGSKNRIAKFIIPLMTLEAKKYGITNWVEPMVGGGNSIDKVDTSYFFKRTGFDLNPHAIKALIAIRDFSDILPENVTEEYYKQIKNDDPEPVKSWIRFVCSVGCKFDNGFARDKTNRNYASEGKRNALKQTKNIQGVNFICDDFINLNFENSLIYCDPPYKGTTGYKTKSFDYDKFYNWCRNQKENGNIVFVSEYEMPEDFKEVWQGEIKTNLASQRTEATHKAFEKLFKL